MSVVNKALEPFTESNHSLSDQHMVMDLPFSKDEKKAQSSNYRPYIIIALLFVSVTIFTYDRFSTSSVELDPLNIEPIAIESVLADKPFEYSNLNIGTKAPDSVSEFVSSYNFIPVPADKEKEAKVVIYEIIDKVDNSQKIIVFLKEANALLKADKLTSPKGRNAFERYQMVLSLDADNKEALDGINRIVNRYVNLAERVIKKKETYKVAGLIKSAYVVGEQYMDMAPIVSRYASYIDDQSVFINNIPAEVISGDVIKTNAVVTDSVNNNESDLISIERSISDVDRDIALTASKLIEEKNISGAIAVLERFTSLSDYWAKSYDLLFSLYLKQSKMKQAEQLVSSNTTLDTFQLAEKVARLFIANDDAAGALSLLNSHSPNIGQYNEYYAIKAGLYHDSQRYNQAIDLYRKLIQVDYDNSRYWLGLAVSLDATADTGAVEAFRYAYEYSLPNSNVKDYIEQRLLVLAQ